MVLVFFGRASVAGARNKKAHVEFCFRTEKATFTVCESLAPRSRRGDEERLSLWYEDEEKKSAVKTES